MRKMMSIVVVICMLMLGSSTLLNQGGNGEQVREGVVDLRPKVIYPTPGETIIAEEGMRVNVTVENLGDTAANGTGYVSVRVKVPTTGDIIFNPFNMNINFTGSNELGPGENSSFVFSNWTTATKGSYLLEVEVVYPDDNSSNNLVSFTIYVKSKLWPGPIDISWSVDPLRGHTDSLFTYEATYGYNRLPDVILLQIDGVNHTMLEKDPLDLFPDDGKDYYFSKYLELGDHQYKFIVKAGDRRLNTSMITGPWVNITLRDPSVMPVAGYITTDFHFAVNYGSVDNDPPDEIFVEVGDKRINLTRDTPTTNYVSAKVKFQGSARGIEILQSPMVLYYECRTGQDVYRIGPFFETGPRLTRTNLTGVVRGQDQVPLEGVLVELNPGGVTTTDETGAYRLQTYVGIGFELRYSLEGYENVYFNDIDLTGQGDHPINPIMTAIPGGAVLEGYVRDEDGLPVEGIMVNIESLALSEQFTTNRTGHYIFEDLPRTGGYTVSVNSHIYEFFSVEVDLSADGNVVQNITLEERVISIYLDPHSGIVPVDQSFTLSFPNPINRSSLVCRIVNSTDVLFATIDYSQNDTLVTLDPVNDLLYDSEYRIILDEGVEDMEGIIVSWRTLTWTVTTQKQPFSGIEADPLDEEEEVLLDADIHLRFGIGLQMDTFEYELVKRGVSGGPVLTDHIYEEELNWSRSGARSVHITIDPGNLEYDATYLLVIETGLLDQYGRPLFTQPFSLEFMTCREPDTDGDGVVDSLDMFPLDPEEWEDTDGDGIGNNADMFPLDPEEWEDTDGDGIGNNADPDDDNDGMPDVWEVKYGLDPLNPADFDQDPDGDGYTNLEEYRAGTNPQDRGSHPEAGEDGDWLLYIVVALVLVALALVVIFFIYRRKTPADPGEE